MKTKFNKNQEKELNNVLGFLNNAKRFILKDNIVIAYKNKSPNNLSFVNKNGEGIDELTKFTGSDLMYLLNAINRLNELINPDTETN